METTIIKVNELIALQQKAAKWDKLNQNICDFYESYDEQGNEIPPKKRGDLCDIGEIAAIAFGYL